MVRLPAKITVRLPHSIREKLCKHIARTGRLTPSEVVRRALRKFLEEEEARLLFDNTPAERPTKVRKPGSPSAFIKGVKS